MPLILSGNVASATADAGYTVANSCRFNSADSAYLKRTQGTPTSDQIGTISFWFKRSSLGDSVLYNNYVSGVPQEEFCYLDFRNDDELRFACDDPGTFNRTTQDRYFRDQSAWMHFVGTIDTTQGAEADRVKLYINGEQITSTWREATMPSQNDTINLFTASAADGNRIGVHYNGSGYYNYFNGYMSEFVYCDGQAYAASSFGEFDEDSPTIWKPKDVSGLTFGDEGFYLSFSDSADLGADSSGNSNDFTAVNLAAADQATDTPTNNFATLNPVDAHTTSPTFAEGNLDFHAPSGTAFTPSRATIAVSKGKWYVEFKATTASATLGACSTQSPMDDHMRDSSDVRSIYRLTGGYWYGQNNGGAIDDQGDNSETFTDDDICMCALDMDNGYFYFGINGTWVNGQDGSTTGDPAGNNGGSGGAGNPSSQLLTNQHDGVYTFFAMDGSTAGTGQLQANFGNPPYTISSGNADADGYGNFEYAPPSGFYALCTKNLAEYG